MPRFLHKPNAAADRAALGDCSFDGDRGPATELFLRCATLMFDGEQIVKRGSWLYDGVVPAAVVITRGNMFFGSGDEEDPPALREDREVQTFRIWFESPPGSDNFPAGGGQYLSIDDAMEGVSKLLPNVPQWE